MKLKSDKKTYIVFFILVGCLCSCGIFKKKNITQAGANEEYIVTFADAGKFKMMGSNQEALNLYKKAAALNPKSSASYYRIAELEMLSKNYESALLNSQTASNLEPLNKWYLIQMAAICDELKMYQKADKIYDNLLVNFKEDYIFDLCEERCKRLQYWSKLINLLNLREKNQGFSSRYYIDRANIYKRINKNDLVIKELRNCLLVDSLQLDCSLLLIENYIENENIALAENKLNVLKSAYPANGRVMWTSALLNMIKNKEEAFITDLKVAFVSEDIGLQNKIDILIQLFNSGKIDNDQLDELNFILLRMYPKESALYKMNANIQVNRKNNAEAKKYFIGYFELIKDDLEMWLEFMDVLLNLNDFSEFNKYAHQASELYLLQPIFFLYSGICEFKLGEYKNAEKSFKNGLEVLIDDKVLEAQFYQNMGELYNKTGDYVQSDKYFDLYLKIDNNNLLVLANYAYYLALRNDKLQLAEQYILKCLSTVADDMYFLDTYALINFQKRDYKKAWEFSEKALKYGGNTNYEILKRAGDIQEKLENKDKALNYWNMALKLNPDNVELKNKIEKFK